MANRDAAFGFRAIRKLNGGQVVVNTYVALAGEANAMFVGMPVKSGGSANTDGVPSITRAAATDTLRGVIAAFEPNRDDLSQMHRAASTARLVLVNDDPDTIFIAQEDGDTTPLTADDIGLRVDFIGVTGNTSHGNSTAELNSDSPKSTSDGNFKLMALHRVVDNAIGANAIYEVMIAEHELDSATAGV